MNKQFPASFAVTIVGITSPDRGCSCVDHAVCGSEVCKGMLIRLRKIQIFNNQEEAIAAYRVSDGVDQCRVGFLPCHCIKDAVRYDGVKVHVDEVYSDDYDDITKWEKHYKMKGFAVGKIILDTSNK